MSNAHAYSCLTCSKTFAFAGSLAAHTQVRGHVAHPGASDSPSVTAITNRRHLCTTCTTPKEFASAYALGSHVKAKHPLPANDGRSPPTTPSAVVPMSHAQVSRGAASTSAPAHAPANAPATATQNPRHVCQTCATPRAFASAGALRAHVKAKHTPEDHHHPHPLPVNPAHPTPPVTAIPAHRTPHARHICTVCPKHRQFATAEALRDHTTAKHGLRPPPAPSAPPAIPADPTPHPRHVCTTCTRPARAFASATALRAHAKAKHPLKDHHQPHAPPANAAHPTMPVNPPATALPAHPTPHARHICTTCTPRRGFATADALRTHTAAKHGPRPTPARSSSSKKSKSKKRTSPPPPYEWNRADGNYEYAGSDAEFDYAGLVGVDSDGDFECIGGCANDGSVMCKNCH